MPPRELTTAELVRLVNEARELGVQRFYFTGGEPFMRIDIFELIEHVCRESELVILTNATYFSRSVLERLAGAVERANGKRGAGAPRRLHMQVSLDGPDAALHEAVRGRAPSIARSPASESWWLSELTPAVSTSVTIRNVDRMAETMRLLASLGVKDAPALAAAPRARRRQCGRPAPRPVARDGGNARAFRACQRVGDGDRQ